MAVETKTLSGTVEGEEELDSGLGTVVVVVEFAMSFDYNGVGVGKYWGDGDGRRGFINRSMETVGRGGG